jgi:mRNA interferase RelE/StbE
MKKSGSKSWFITYHELVVRIDIPRLGKAERDRVRRAIEQKIAINPVLYGIPLRGTLKQYWKVRVGNWRIVYSIFELEVRILVIAHRKDVYGKADKRI